MIPADLRDLLGVPFTDEQLAAACAPLEPGVVIAGAGSGKTSVMAARVVWLVASGQVLPEQVLGLTFTNKAAAELASRIRDALRKAQPSAQLPSAAQPVEIGEPTVATYHAYAGRLLREHGLRIGVEPASRLLADATRFQVAERVLRRAEGPFPALEKTVGALVGDLVQLDGELNEHLVTVAELVAEDRAVAAEAGAAKQTLKVAEVVRTCEQRTQLAHLVELLRAEKERLGVLDFGDQLAAAAQLAREHPAVGASERERFAVVLLDEYQDTSYAQKRLLLDLFGGGHPVTAVGDPCQAIYGWRGASVGNIDAFPDDFRTAAGPARRYGLARNNRSGGRLLQLTNALAGPLRERHPGVGLLEPRPEVADSGDTVCGLFATYAEEVAWVCDRVARTVAEGTAPRDVAILVRVRSDFAAYHDALVSRGVPVEVVGLGGLLSLPEVADLVATLAVLDDVTANPALLRLLAGPRWRIGPRDLAALGRRGVDLVRAANRPGDEGDLPVEALLELAVEGVDPAEVVSLSEALDRPGDPARFGYSAEALERFARLSAELRELRRHLGEPLLDLLGRILSTSGLDVEVGAAPYAPSSRRSDALVAFLDHAAAFADLEGDPSVRAFLSFLRAAETFDRGLDTSAPSPGDSVKLLTVHKAKGLEWPVVVLPNLTADVFPAKRGRPRWTERASTLPSSLRGDAEDFPTVDDWSIKGLAAMTDQMRALDRLEELRLGYVALTRARSAVVATSHWWGPTQKNPRGPSPYLCQIREHCLGGAGEVAAWVAEPAEGATNPGLDVSVEHTWPHPLEPSALAERRRSASWVRAGLADLPALLGSLDTESDALAPTQRDLVGDWDRDLAALLEEARRAHLVDLDVPLPVALSATELVRLVDDPHALAAALARPMPRRPAPAARRGTRFHSWVESLFGERPLLDRAELSGAADDDVVPDESLGDLQAAFLAGPFATRAPFRIEAPFQLVLGGRVVRGRIDAVYRNEDGSFDVIDWKTGRGAADPLQLAIYRAAWARLARVPEDRVGAAFYYVPTGAVDRPDGLPGAVELERLLSGPVS